MRQEKIEQIIGILKLVNEFPVEHTAKLIDQLYQDDTEPQFNNVLHVTEELTEFIAEELFSIWKEAKESSCEGWGDTTFEELPEKHKQEYYLTAARILARTRASTRFTMRKPLPKEFENLLG